MKQKGILLFFLLLVISMAFSQAKVFLIPTIHSLHKSNSLYSYDSLKAIVGRANADVIVIEIRAIDINRDTNYLRRNYPYEMWMMRYWFPGKIIEGFDWLGAELEGKPIPTRYWQDESRIKEMERQLDRDSVYRKKLSACHQYTENRLPILKNKSLDEILTSNDSLLIREYYDCMKQELEGSVYQELPDFYTERNRQMELRLKSIIQQHGAKKIVVLTGDDHYPYLMEYLKKEKIELLKPVNF